MATPDVRVRLTAEGVAEVVAALKKVQAEGEKASAKQARGFSGLNRVLGSTSSLLTGLGVTPHSLGNPYCDICPSRVAVGVMA